LELVKKTKRPGRENGTRLLVPAPVAGNFHGWESGGGRSIREKQDREKISPIRVLGGEQGEVRSFSTGQRGGEGKNWSDTLGNEPEKQSGRKKGVNWGEKKF